MTEQQNAYKELWDRSDAFKLTKWCIDNNTTIPLELFDNESEYGYFIESLFFEVTPFCGCGSDPINKIKEYLSLLTKELDVYDNELLYSFAEKDGVFEHGSSIGGCRLTSKGKFVMEVLKQYKDFLEGDTTSDQK